jgi:hypothetical protein
VVGAPFRPYRSTLPPLTTAGLPLPNLPLADLSFHLRSGLVAQADVAALLKGAAWPGGFGRP